MSLLDTASLCTLSNKSAFNKVSLSFEDASSVLEDVNTLNGLKSSNTELTSKALTFGVSSVFEDLSAQISLACPFIFPSNSCRSDSEVLSCGAVASGSELAVVVVVVVHVVLSPPWWWSLYTSRRLFQINISRVIIIFF
jgi:hypothetical protein